MDDDTMRMEASERDTVLAAMLAQHADAYICAISPMGELTPLPEDLQLAGQRPVQRGLSSAIGLAIGADRLIVSAAWNKANDEGVAGCSFHPVAAPERVARLHLVDATHRYGVFIALITGLGEHPPGASLAHEAIKPRVVTVSKDQTAMIIEADPDIESLLGWSAGEMVGRRSLEFVHPDDHERGVNSWVDMLAAPTGDARRVRLRHLHRDGQIIWFELTNRNFLADPERPRVVTEMLDISDEMAAQEALQASEQLLRRLTETLPLSVIQVDADRRVIYQNERAVRTLGTSVGDILDDDRLRRTVPEDRPQVNEAFDAVLGAASDVDVEFGLLEKTRGLRRINGNFRALTSTAGDVTGAIICLTDVTDDVRLRDELKHRATIDALTGCRNRASSLTALTEFLALPADRSRGTSVIFIDLNEFKQINDRLGHAAGDQVLVHVANQLRSVVRDSDVVGRLGGDEFVVFCRDVPGPAPAQRIADGVLKALDARGLDLAGSRVVPRASIGIAWAPPGVLDAEMVIARADAAMYEAKRDPNARPVMTLVNH